MDSRKKTESHPSNPYVISDPNIDCITEFCTIKGIVPNIPVSVEPVSLTIYNMNFEDGSDIAKTEIRQQDINHPAMKEVFINKYGLHNFEWTDRNPFELKYGPCGNNRCYCYPIYPLTGQLTGEGWATFRMKWEEISEPTPLSEFPEFDNFDNIEQATFDQVKAFCPEYFQLIDRTPGNPYKVRIRRRYEAEIKYKAKRYDYQGKCRPYL